MADGEVVSVLDQPLACCEAYIQWPTLGKMAQTVSSIDNIPTDVLINTFFTFFNSCLLILLILGIALFYSGLTHRKSSLQQLAFPLLIICEIMILWLCFGYSLSFSSTGGSHYLGNFQNIGLKDLNIIVYPNARFENDNGVIGTMYAIYEGLFCCVAASLIMGCIAERGRLKPALIFLIPWCFLVYCPISYWEWNPNGWVFQKFEILDFAGGSVVHIVSGVTALVYSWFLGHRINSNLTNYKSFSFGNVAIGTFMTLIGWFGFNCGSAFEIAPVGTIMANTLTASLTSGISWCLLDYFASSFSESRKISVVGICSGMIAGLVGITPATGFVNYWSSFIIGFVVGISCNLSTRIKYWIKVDDSLDVFAIHGVGGFIGNLLTGLFADKNVALRQAGLVISGGWVNRHFIQLLHQFVVSLIVVVYCFGMCCVILLILSRIPGCHLTVSEKGQVNGVDADQLSNEFMFDFVEYIRDLNPMDYTEEVIQNVQSPEDSYNTAHYVESQDLDRHIHLPHFQQENFFSEDLEMQNLKYHMYLQQQQEQQERQLHVQEQYQQEQQEQQEHQDGDVPDIQPKKSGTLL